MKNGKIVLQKDYKIGEVDRRIFSSFVEHMGRAVYTGIYEPDHPTADEQGFRGDVLEQVRGLSVPMVRYPGGNFVSGYHWKDGIGPVDQRPTVCEKAWHSIEPNRVGIDEFSDWAKKAGTTLMPSVNMGTGTPEEAGDLVEYCNLPRGTRWADQRARNGHEAPYGYKTWCLGNEMDGDWQICHLTAEEYGRKALETAKLMKWTDPSIELVASGSSGSEMATYPEWDRVILEHLYDKVDYISLHKYYRPLAGCTEADFLASWHDLDGFIHTIVSTADYVQTLRRSSKKMKLSLDEWNVWSMSPNDLTRWQHAPRIVEDIYTSLDALVVGGMLCTILNHADRVKIACLAQLVNIIAPIYTEPGGRVLRQSIYYPFKHGIEYAKGSSLLLSTELPTMETKLYGEVPSVQAAATYDEETGNLSVFAVNCDLKEPITLALDLHSFGGARLSGHTVLRGDLTRRTNTFDKPDEIVPGQLPVSGEEDFVHSVTLPALSWNVLQIHVKA